MGGMVPAYIPLDQVLLLINHVAQVEGMCYTSHDHVETDGTLDDRHRE
jgi:hypothetical protein